MDGWFPRTFPTHARRPDALTLIATGSDQAAKLLYTLQNGARDEMKAAVSDAALFALTYPT